MQRTTTPILARPGEWLLLAALLASYPLSAVFAPGWGREGGILENAQVLVLGAGLVAATLAFGRTRPGRTALLALWAAPVWLLLAGRELSWGRVLLPQPGLEATHGLAANGIHWLQHFVRPGAVLLALALLLAAWRFRLDEVVRAGLARRTPWLCFAVALAAALGSTCAEGHMGCSLGLPAGRSVVFEELAELLAYVSLIMIQSAVLRQAPALRHPAAPVSAPAVAPIDTAAARGAD
ncbi:hypothetical protein [Massilia sp. YIM B02443]|uniref:hypothetical protein n=1 Tax=Massilia sp. YIM B02443 TaxID=3050127 RepID=UPI0025B6F1BA|nr:hypothetical protein [Massilia sp. YIM B02443]MDN4040002.1 hypothetical protein [Massilia sp. YIM B02443]